MSDSLKRDASNGEESSTAGQGIAHGVDHDKLGPLNSADIYCHQRLSLQNASATFEKVYIQGLVCPEKCFAIQRGGRGRGRGREGEWETRIRSDQECHTPFHSVPAVLYVGLRVCRNAVLSHGVVALE